jgi:hypothetical protein
MQASGKSELIVEETGALILDTRKWCFYRFIPQSINIGIEVTLPWVGALPM